MSKDMTIDSLRDERAKETFLKDYAEARSSVTEQDVALAFRDALRAVAPSEPVEALEREMDIRLGLKGDEEG